MTRPKKARVAKDDATEAGRGSGRNAEIRWINPTTNNKDIEWLENNPNDSMEDVMVMFEGLQFGQRFTCKYDDRTTRWIAVLFDSAAGEDGKIPALSVRGASALDAILVCAYYTIRKYPDGWQQTGSASLGRFGQS